MVNSPIKSWLKHKEQQRDSYSLWWWKYMDLILFTREISVFVSARRFRAWVKWILQEARRTFFLYVFKKKIIIKKKKCQWCVFVWGLPNAHIRSWDHITEMCSVNKQMCVFLPAVSVPVVHLHFNWPERFKTEHLETLVVIRQKLKREQQLNWWMLSDDKRA